MFTGGKGGVAHFFGPTGGYLVGFAAAVFVAGLIAHQAETSTRRDVAAVLVGTLCVYAFGVPWLKAVTGMPWEKAFLAGMVPFLIGDGLKAASAVILARALRPVLQRQMLMVSA